MVTRFEAVWLFMRLNRFYEELRAPRALADLLLSSENECICVLSAQHCRFPEQKDQAPRALCSQPDMLIFLRIAARRYRTHRWARLLLITYAKTTQGTLAARGCVSFCTLSEKFIQQAWNSHILLPDSTALFQQYKTEWIISNCNKK
jgi:hypothetical protein